MEQKTLQPLQNAKLYSLKVYLDHLFKDHPEELTGEEIITLVVEDMRQLNKLLK